MSLSISLSISLLSLYLLLSLCPLCLCLSSRSLSLSISLSLSLSVSLSLSLTLSLSLSHSYYQFITLSRSGTLRVRVWAVRRRALGHSRFKRQKLVPELRGTRLNIVSSTSSSVPLITGNLISLRVSTAVPLMQKIQTNSHSVAHSSHNFLPSLSPVSEIIHSIMDRYNGA